MKTKLKLNIGGELSTGDVVGVAYNNCIVFGWFVEEGQNGSLKFIQFSVVEQTKSLYDNYIATPDSYKRYAKKFANGLIFKNFAKEYIIKFSPLDNRAFKISDPEEFFKDSGLESKYISGKQILNNLKFPAK